MDDNLGESVKAGPTALQAMGGPAFNVLPLWPSQPLSFWHICVGYTKIYIDVLDVQKCKFFSACLSADMRKCWNNAARRNNYYK